MYLVLGKANFKCRFQLRLQAHLKQQRAGAAHPHGGLVLVCGDPWGTRGGPVGTVTPDSLSPAGLQSSALASAAGLQSCSRAIAIRGKQNTISCSQQHL